MEKSSFGISIPLTLFIVYLSGVMGYIPMILVVGYVLIKERNITIKKSAILILILTLINLVLSVVSGFLYSMSSSVSIGILFILGEVLSSIADIVSSIGSLIKLFMIFLAIISLLGKELKLSFLDKFCEKHL